MDIPIKSDDELIKILTERYEPTIVPACRVCGAELKIAACGGGAPTKYACSTQSIANGTIDWTHYENSGWEDRRQGGDANVIELISRYLSKSKPPEKESHLTDILSSEATKSK